LRTTIYAKSVRRNMPTQELPTPPRPMNSFQRLDKIPIHKGTGLLTVDARSYTGLDPVMRIEPADRAVQTRFGCHFSLACTWLVSTSPPAQPPAASGLVPHLSCFLSPLVCRHADKSLQISSTSRVIRHSGLLHSFLRPCIDGTWLFWGTCSLGRGLWG